MISYVTYYLSSVVNYFQDLYEKYIYWNKILSGNEECELSHLQLSVRALKVCENLEVKKDETFINSCHDMVGYILSTTDQKEIEKYCPYVPGIIYEQNKDGIHIKIKDDDNECIIMSSLSYWGFHANDEVLNYAIQKASDTGVGNHGSYLVTGRNTVVEEAYQKLSKFFNRRYSVIAASGFLSCMNLVKFLVPKDGIIFIDERAHVCLKFGSSLTKAKTIKFPHNNFDKLDVLMEKNRHKYKGRAILVLDGIYSAEGTLADLPKAKSLCNKYKVQLVVDEAHSLGSIGRTGHGIEEHYDMVGSCDFICGVFSKSLASYGGFVVSNHSEVMDLNVSPGIGFATGLNSFSAATVSKGLDIIEREGEVVRRNMEDLREYFVSELNKYDITNIRHIGHDVFLTFSNNISAIAISMNMRKRGYYVSAFMFPSVPLGMSTIRLTINPLITREIIDKFCIELDSLLITLGKTKTKTGRLLIKT